MITTNYEWFEVYEEIIDRLFTEIEEEEEEEG